MVGSPPENWTAGVGTGRWARRSSIIPITWSKVGSYTNPQARALAKQKSQLRLHRFVRSMFASRVSERCCEQSPHSCGQFTSGTTCWGFSIPFPTWAYPSNRSNIAASDQYSERIRPCSGHSRSIQTFPSWS